MIGFKEILAHRNRGLLLDITVFVVQLILLRFLAKLALSFAHQAEEDRLAKIAVGLFLVGLFFLQPLGPILKRWSFHQHYQSFDKVESDFTHFLLTIYRLIYIAIMGIIFYLAYSYLLAAFPDFLSERAEALVVAGAMIMSVVNGIVIFRYFRAPKKAPRWKFLTSPQAEALGDLCMLLNLICFQSFWSVYISSPHFWNTLHKITRQESGQFLNVVSSRLYVTTIAALLLYFPPRIFYLVIDQHRKITWLAILLANLPLVLAAVFYAPSAAPPKSLKEPSFIVTAEELHREYESDYEAGARKYFGRYVDITGRVQTRFFPRSLELDVQIGLDGNDGYPRAYCSFDEDQVETAETLEINQMVTLQCVGSDHWGNGPTLEHCVLVNAQ